MRNRSSADPEYPIYPGTTKASLPALKLLQSILPSVISTNRPSYETVGSVETSLSRDVACQTAVIPFESLFIPQAVSESLWPQDGDSGVVS